MASLGNHLSDLEKHDAALTAASEAVDLFRDLESPELGGALLNLGNRASDCRRFEDAVTWTLEAIEILEPAAESSDSRAVLALAKENLALRYMAVQQTADALVAVDEALAIHAALRGRDPAEKARAIAIQREIADRHDT